MVDSAFLPIIGHSWHEYCCIDKKGAGVLSLPPPFALLLYLLNRLVRLLDYSGFNQ